MSGKYRESDEDLNMDILIVGGGVIGLGSAFELARQGATVTVLERGACGGESSWAGVRSRRVSSRGSSVLTFTLTLMPFRPRMRVHAEPAISPAMKMTASRATPAFWAGTLFPFSRCSLCI